MTPIALRLEARDDLVEAALWYEEQRVGLSDRFLDAVSAAMQVIAARPNSFPIVHRDVRRALVKRFPYAIYFRVESDHILVFAIVHTSRSSRAWRDRQ